MIHAERLRVVDEEMNDVPADGETMGEIVMRGNNVMKGYFEDDEATAEAFSGRLVSLRRPRGHAPRRLRAAPRPRQGRRGIRRGEHLHGRDRAGAPHPRAVRDVAVIGVPDEKWGERPKAFVVLEPGAQAGEEELIDHVRSAIARYKAPKAVAFLDELPKTSTGKVPKFELREREWAGLDSRIKG